MAMGMISEKERHNHRALVASLLGCGLLLLALTTAQARPTPAAKCEALKNKEAGKYAFCLEKARMRLVKTKGACSTTATTTCYRDDECPTGEACTKETTKYDDLVTKCDTKFLGKWAKAEEKAGAGVCPDGISDPNTLAAFVKHHCDAVAQALTGGGLPRCGDGVINVAGEQCDGGDLDGEDCVSLGFGDGMLGCTAGCTFDTASCTAIGSDCGNAVLDPGESCELGTLEGADCLSLGFGGGTLGCLPGSCQYDTSSCEPLAERDMDLVVLFDATADMADEVASLRTELASTVLPALRYRYPESQFAVAKFRDFPVSPYGNPGDFPYLLVQSLTANLAAVQSAMLSVATGGGGDALESGNEALYQVATGEGLSPFIAPGLVGFRPGAAHLVLVVTSAAFHAPTDYGASVLGAHDRMQATFALNAADIQVVGVVSSSMALAQLQTYAVDTGAVVAPADLGEVTGCPTGISGALVPRLTAGCPLVFEVDTNSGLGLASDKLVTGVGVLVESP